MSADIRVVLTTEADQSTATNLVESLVERRLVACASMTPVSSVYRWKGSIQRDIEVQITLKTTSTKLIELESAIDAIHSYDVPEFIVLSSDASASYRSWVEECVGDDSA